MFSSNVRSLFNNSNNCEFGCGSVYHTFELQETNVREEEEGLTEYTAAISAVCLFRQSLRHYWCLCSTLAYKPQCRTGPAPPLPSRSRQLGKNSLRNGGHHAAPAAIQHHHHPVLSSHDLGGEHVLLLLLLVERLHVPRLGSATTAFGRVFLFCLHRVLFLGRSGPSVLLTCGQCACAHSQPRSAQVQTGHTGNCQTMGTLLDVEEEQQQQRVVRLLSKSVRGIQQTRTTTTRRERDGAFLQSARFPPQQQQQPSWGMGAELSLSSTNALGGATRTTQKSAAGAMSQDA